MEIISFNHVSIPVSNMNRSIEFYTSHLGMRLLDNSIRPQNFSEKATGIKGVSLQVAYLEKASLKLELIEYSHKSKDIFDKNNNDIFGHICFYVNGLKEYYKNNMNKLTFVSKPLLIPGGPNKGGLMLYLFDPDNNKIELINAK